MPESKEHYVDSHLIIAVHTSTTSWLTLPPDNLLLFHQSPVSEKQIATPESLNGSFTSDNCPGQRNTDNH